MPCWRHYKIVGNVYRSALITRNGGGSAPPIAHHRSHLISRSGQPPTSSPGRSIPSSVRATPGTTPPTSHTLTVRPTAAASASRYCVSTATSMASATSPARTSEIPCEAPARISPVTSVPAGHWLPREYRSIHPCQAAWRRECPIRIDGGALCLELLSPSARGQPHVTIFQNISKEPRHLRVIFDDKDSHQSASQS